MYNFLLSAASDFSAAVVPVARWVFIGLIFVCSLIIIGATLFQSSSEDNNATAISGGQQESYYSQNKGESKDGKLNRATIVSSIIIAVCTVLYFVSWLIFG